MNRILAESVVQLVRKEAGPGREVEGEQFQLNIRPETHMFENNPFRCAGNSNYIVFQITFFPGTM